MFAIAKYRLALFLALAIGLTATVFLAVVWAGTTPAGAQDGYQPDEQLIDDVRGYSQETEKGYDHVLRWMRVLHTFDALDDVTAAEAQDYADNGWQRWDPVADALADLENAPDDYQPDEQLISAVRGYSQETESGYDHVLRWMRVLHAFGALDDMAAAEAQRYADNGWERWDPVAEELAQLEASTADPEPTLTPEPTPEPTPTATPEPTPTATPDPNRAPVVNTQAANYAAFVATGNAPRGVIVWKMFNGIFSDPDGDELTYSASVPADQLHLVDSLSTYFDVAISGGGVADFLAITVDGDDDWKAMTPPVPEQVRFTVSLTATDPGGRSATVQGKWLTRWESYPEVVSAVARGSSIELTFDWAVEDDPAPSPGQFTVHVVNGDGSSRTVAVSSVSVSGKVVRLELASGLEAGQSVTLDYAYDYPDDTPLQRAGGGDPAPGFSGQPVAVSLLELPQNFAVTVKQGVLNLWATWDAVDGATSYNLAWRPADGEFEADNATTVADTGATFTVSGYGEWEVRLQACNDDGCGPEASRTVEVVQSIGLHVVPTLDAEGHVRPRTFSAFWVPVPGAASYTLRWQRVGVDSQTQAQPAAAGSQGANTQGENQLNLSANQTSADFTVPDDGEYQAELQARDDGNELIAQGDNAVNPADDQPDTTPPRLVQGEIDGNVMTVYASEPLDEDAVGGFFRVNVLPDGCYPYCPGPFTATGEMEVSGNKVIVDLGEGRRVRAGDAVETRYVWPIDSTAEKLRDRAGNGVSTPYSYAYRGSAYQSTALIFFLDNLTLPPSLKRATVNLHRLTLTFDETLDGNSVPVVGAFTVKVRGSAVSLASVEPVAVAGDTVTLVLADPVAESDVVTVSYSKPSSGPLRNRNSVGGDVGNFSDETVINLTGVVPAVSDVAISSGAGPDRSYALGEEVRILLTFNEAVNVAGAPRLKIKLDPNHGEEWAEYASGSSTTMLEFTYTVVEPNISTQGVAVLRNTLELNGGTIRSMSTSTEADLWQGGLGHDPDHQVDWRAPAPGVPSVSSVAITSDSGDDDTYSLGDVMRVTVTFSEAVDVTGSPRLEIDLDPGDWGEKWAIYEGGSGTSSLTFIYEVADSNFSSRGIAVLEHRLDLNGGKIRSAASQRDVHLWYMGLDHDPSHKMDGTTPSLRSVTVDGTTVVLAFSEPLDEDSVPPASAFMVKKTPQGGEEETVNLIGSPSIEGVTVILTMASPWLNTDTDVRVSYQGPALGVGNRLRDQAGNDAAIFTDRTDDTPPRLVRGEIDGDVITLFFSEPLDENSGGAGDFYRINLQWNSLHGGAPHYGRCKWKVSDGSYHLFTVRPREVYVSGNTVVVVGLKEDPIWRAGVGQNTNNFNYIANITAPAEQRLRDISGNPVSTPHRYHNTSNKYWQTEQILVPSVTRLPYPRSATVVGDRLTLNFNAPMDGDSIPAAGAFAVKVDGSAVSLASASPVAVHDSAVTLKLAAAVAQGDTVTVSYYKPESRPLQNVICEDAESFSDVSATNLTGLVPQVTDVAVSSDPGGDDTYALGDTIQVAVTFSEAVDVTGAPRLKIKLDPNRGEFWANYESGTGTNSLTFAYTVTEPNTSRRGIAVLAQSLELNGGAIRSAATQAEAHLWHAGLDHDPNHQVDWQIPPQPGGSPWVTGLALSSDAGDNDTYGFGDTIRVALTFNEAMTVTGAPRLKIKMDPNWGEFWANYESGTGTNSLTFAYTVTEPNTSPQGVAVIEHGLDLNGGAIRSAFTEEDAYLWYAGLAHDPSHKVDWRR